MSGDPLNVIGRGSPAWAILEANPPKAADTYGNTRADRYRRPGWSDQAEAHYQATHRRRRKRGRPHGSYAVLATRAAFLEAFRAARKAYGGRRPTKGELAQHAGVASKTIDRRLNVFELLWPPE